MQTKSTSVSLILGECKLRLLNFASVLAADSSVMPGTRWCIFSKRHRSLSFNIYHGHASRVTHCESLQLLGGNCPHKGIPEQDSKLVHAFVKSSGGLKSMGSE